MRSPLPRCSSEAVPLPDERLVELLRAYADFDDSSRRRILVAVIRNFRRAVGDDDAGRARRWDGVVGRLAAGDPALSEVAAAGADLCAPRSVVGDRSTRVRWPSTTTAPRALLTAIGRATAELPLTAEAHLRQALDLHDMGLSPLVTYAYNTWQVTGSSSTELGRRLAELQVMGLHRLAPVPSRTGSVVRPLASGAMAQLVPATTPGLVTKVPTSVAARDVAHPLEIRNFLLLQRTSARSRIPGRVTFDPLTSCLTREYVPGHDGSQLLRSGDRLTDPQLLDLRSCFSELRRLTAWTDVRLDLHPGNFVWHPERRRWHLVDLGPVPLAGAAEYQEPSFERYFERSWLERGRCAELVRSLDYLVDA